MDWFPGGDVWLFVGVVVLFDVALLPVVWLLAVVWLFSLLLCELFDEEGRLPNPESGPHATTKLVIASNTSARVRVQLPFIFVPL